MSTRMRSMNERRDRILDAALSIIAENGFDALTTRGLAFRLPVFPPHALQSHRRQVTISLRACRGRRRACPAAALCWSSTPRLEWVRGDRRRSGRHGRKRRDLPTARSASRHRSALPVAMACAGDMGSHPALGEAAMTIALPACEAARAQGLLRGNAQHPRYYRTRCSTPISAKADARMGFGTISLLRCPAIGSSARLHPRFGRRRLAIVPAGSSGPPCGPRPRRCRKSGRA